MSYRNDVLAIAGQPEIWYEFDGNYNTTGWGNQTAITQVGSGTNLYLTDVSLPRGSKSMQVSSFGRARGATISQTGDTTYMAWFLFATTKSTRTIMSFGPTNGSVNAGYWRVDLISGVPQLRQSASGLLVNSGVNCGVQTWHHVVFRRTGLTSGDLWVNGVNRGSNSVSSAMIEVNAHLWLGDNHLATYGDSHNGWIAHAAAFSQRLSDQQIQDLYWVGLQPPPPPPVVLTGFRGWGMKA